MEQMVTKMEQGKKIVTLPPLYHPRIPDLVVRWITVVSKMEQGKKIVTV